MGFGLGGEGKLSWVALGQEPSFALFPEYCSRTTAPHFDKFSAGRANSECSTTMLKSSRAFIEALEIQTALMVASEGLNSAR